MKNRVVAEVSFSFKGQVHELSMTVDLDQIMEQYDGAVPDLYPQLAEKHGIGFYTYEYEMLMAEPICYSKAEGIAADYISDSVFDIEGFAKAWTEGKLRHLLADIAESEMGVDNLDDHPGLERALNEAYRCGKKSG